MANSTFNSDLFVNGSLTSKTFTAPAGSINNTSIAAAAAIDATKVVHQFPVKYSTTPGTAVVASTQLMHIARAAGTLSAVEIMATTAPTSSDQCTVDVKKGNSSTAFASVLSSVVTLDNTHSDLEVVAGTITTTDYSDEDSFQIVVTPTGVTTQGLMVVLWFRESPQ